jgi:hypothetical protein
MLPLLLNVPSDDAESWSIFSFNLREEVRRCNEAILQKKGINLPELQLDPIPMEHTKDWIANVSQSMSGISSALALQSSDLLDVDLTNQNAKVGWVYQLYTQLRDAEAALQI